MTPETHLSSAQLRAYALGDLNPAAARRLEAHLQGCPACRERVLALREELVTLVEELPTAEPQAGSFALVQARSRARRTSRTPWLAAAVLALATFTLGWGLQERQMAASARQQQAVVAGWLARPDLRVLTLRSRQQKTAGRVLLAADRALFVLPPPPAGQAYHAWVGLKRGWKYGDPMRLATSSRSGVFVVPLGDTDYLCYSLERAAQPKRPSRVLGWAYF